MDDDFEARVTASSMRIVAAFIDAQAQEITRIGLGGCFWVSELHESRERLLRRLGLETETVSVPLRLVE